MVCRQRCSRPKTPKTCAADECKMRSGCCGFTCQKAASPETVTSALMWTQTKCESYCLTTGSYFPGSGCEAKMGEPCAASVTSALRWTKSKCTDYCNAFGSYFPGSGCTTKMGVVCAAPVTASLMTGTSSATWSPTAALINAETKEQYRAAQTSALRWTKNNCRDFCLARGDYPNLSPCQRKMGEETCASITA